MKRAEVVLPLTVEQSQMLAAALDITFKSDYFPLELQLGLEYDEEGHSPEEESKGEVSFVGINRIIVTDGTIRA